MYIFGVILTVLWVLFLINRKLKSLPSDLVLKAVDCTCLHTVANVFVQGLQSKTQHVELQPS